MQYCALHVAMRNCDSRRATEELTQRLAIVIVAWQERASLHRCGQRVDIYKAPRPLVGAGQLLEAANIFLRVRRVRATRASEQHEQK